MAPRFRIPQPPQLPAPAAYALAVALPLVALAIQQGLRMWIENIPFVLFFVVVSAAGLGGGTGPGLVAVALSAMAGWWFLATSPEASNRAGALVGAAVFVPAASVVALLGAVVRAGYRDREHAARELSAAVQARDEFVSIASHELKTPIASLTLSVQTLSRFRAGSRSLDDPGVVRALQRVERQAIRIDALVNALLDVSRIGAGKLRLELAEVELGEVVREVASRFEEEAAQAGSPIALAVPGAAAGRWDRLRVEQIVTNLLSNAVKYGAGRPIELSVGTREGAALLTVADHGIGIDPKDHPRLFRRFERIEGAETAPGLGLGLWLARSLVTALGGTIEVESAPGQGTRFTVSLPLEGPPAAERRASAGERPGATERRRPPPPLG